MKQSTVSIVIPAYNAEKYISNTIDSVLCQTFEDWELLIINDGSKDNTPRICDCYAKRDQRIRVIHKDNEGVSVARNWGIEFARGKYIAFVDADDYIIPQYLEALVSSIGDADICLFPMQLVAQYRDIPLGTKYERFTCTRYTLQEGYEILADRGMLHPPFCKIFILKKILQNGIRFESSIAMGEDLLFNLGYLDVCKTLAIGEEPVYYYIKGNSVLSRTIRKDYADLQLRFYDEQELFCKRHAINYTLKNQLYHILYEAYASIAQEKRLTYEERKSALTRIRHSALAKNYLSDSDASTIKESLFRMALRLPLELIISIKIMV